jgi:septum formation protein
MQVILASGSVARAKLLRDAGVDFTIDTAAVDEVEIKLSLKSDQIPVERVAETLAETKASRVAARQLGPTYDRTLVIGADQMLEADDIWLDKPSNLAEARQHLQLLRGRSHRLVSSVVLVLGGKRIWHHTAEAYLRMRPFSDTFLEQYLTQSGPAILGSVGCYQLEGIGVQLFDRIDGDFFTILGLPLLPLLGQLRQLAILKE